MDTVGPDTVSDFYPHNMLNDNHHSPYLTRLGRALHELFIEPSPQQQAKIKGKGSRFRYEATVRTPALPLEPGCPLCPGLPSLAHPFSLSFPFWFACARRR